MQSPTQHFDPGNPNQQVDRASLNIGDLATLSITTHMADGRDLQQSNQQPPKSTIQSFQSNIPRNPNQQTQLTLQLGPNQQRPFAQHRPPNPNQSQFPNPNKQVIKSQPAKSQVQSLLGYSVSSNKV